MVMEAIVSNLQLANSSLCKAYCSSAGVSAGMRMTNLVKLGGKKVEGSKNSAVWTQAIRFHDIFIIHLHV